MFVNKAVLSVALGLGLLATGLQAHASPIFKSAIGSQEASKSKRFAFDADTGRAWVEIDIHHTISESVESHRIVVPGLIYNQKSAQIVFASGGEAVPCANVREAGFWIFKHSRIDATGQCALTKQYVEESVDDGFSVKSVEKFEVHLKTSSATSGA